MENISIFILIAVISSFFINAGAFIYKIHILTIDDVSVFQTAFKLALDKKETEIDLSRDLKEISIQ